MNPEQLVTADSVAQYELIEDFDKKREELKRALEALEGTKTASPDQVAAARKALDELQEAMKHIKRTI